MSDPPAPEEAEAFIDDKSPDAYEKLVDRLLASPRFAEMRATDWLDAVRFADSDSAKTAHAGCHAAQFVGA